MQIAFFPFAMDVEKNIRFICCLVRVHQRLEVEALADRQDREASLRADDRPLFHALAYGTFGCYPWSWCLREQQRDRKSNDDDDVDDEYQYEYDDD